MGIWADEYAVPFSSGNAALHNAALNITFLAHNNGKEGEVITGPFIFIAAVNSIRYTENLEVRVHGHKKAD